MKNQPYCKYAQRVSFLKIAQKKKIEDKAKERGKRHLGAFEVLISKLIGLLH
jgi:hypothetical protein